MDPSIVDWLSNYLNTLLDETFWYFREIAWQLVIAVIAYLSVCVFSYIVLLNVNKKAWQLRGPPSRVLFVTAHPDDEVMFFGPTIYRMVEDKNCEIYLLCLSIGGDKRRKEELWASAKVLGIPEANVTILMSTQLPDDPEVRWPENLIAETILQHVESYGINAVVTFDKRGISGHRNHISIFYGVASLCMENKLPNCKFYRGLRNKLLLTRYLLPKHHFSDCKMYVLESVNVFRKYTLLLDLPISLLFTSYWYLISFKERKNIHKAMIAHESQYVWFRKLYMKFSRYTLINTLQEISTIDLELDLEFDDD